MAQKKWQENIQGYSAELEDLCGINSLLVGIPLPSVSPYPIKEGAQ